MNRARQWLLALHILAWMALIAATFATAGPYAFASCWGVILIYVPPVTILIVAIAGFSLVVLLVSIARPATRKTLAFSLASHGMILTAGLIACNRSAFAAAGQVNCL